MPMPNLSISAIVLAVAVLLSKSIPAQMVLVVKTIGVVGVDENVVTVVAANEIGLKVKPVM